MAYDLASLNLQATYDSSMRRIKGILFDTTRLGMNENRLNLLSSRSANLFRSSAMVGDGQLIIHDFSGQALESFGYRHLHGVRVL